MTNVIPTKDEYQIVIEYSSKDYKGNFTTQKVRTIELIRKEVAGFYFLHYQPTDETRMIGSEQLKNIDVFANYVLNWAYLISINE